MTVVFTPAPEGTLPPKDWFRHYGIDGVQTEDHSIIFWEKWLQKAQRMGHRTPTTQLYRHFKNYRFIKQVDVPADSNRSSDIVAQHFILEGRCLCRFTGGVVLGEHAVKRYWQHTNRKPNIISWLQHQRLAVDTEELYDPQGLLLGHLIRSTADRYVIDRQQIESYPVLGFYVKTVIPTELLNESQRYRWYKLKEKELQ